MDELAKKSFVGLPQFIFVLGILLFACAWTVDFWQAWIYLAIFAASAALITLYLSIHDPRLLERRVNVGPGAEKEPSQKRIQLFAAMAFLGTLVLPALDHRYKWSRVPLAMEVVGEIFVALGFLIIFNVFKINTFSPGTIEIAADHRVISTGPYSIVRHPMYSGALVMLLGTPLALGSWCGLLMFFPMLIVIVWRLLDEEAFLDRNLQGYFEYRRKIRYRLLPFVW